MNKVTREHLAGLELALSELDIDGAAAVKLIGLIAQASTAPEQEAVDPVVIEVQNGCVYLISKPLEPGRHKLYTHADQSEVERLRAELEQMHKSFKAVEFKMAEAIHDQGLLRQKLAEAQALLRDIAQAYWQQDAELPADIVARLKPLSATAQPAEVKS